jgi:starch synthase
VAIIPWGLAIEDFLAPNGLTLEDFCTEFTGSWVFGYARALRSAGIRPVLLVFTARPGPPRQVVHTATATDLSLIAVPPVYRALRARMRNPYGRGTGDVFPGGAGAARPLRAAARELAPYLATPVHAAARELRRRGCDTVLCQEYEFPRFDVLVAAGRAHGFRVFGVFQGGDYQRWRLERPVRPRAIGAAAGLVVAAEAERERLSETYPLPPVAAIPNPVDLATWRPGDRAAARSALGIDPSASVVAWHGRIDITKKGLDVLLDAWLELSRRRQDAVLLLIGTGRGAAALRAAIRGARPAEPVWVDRYVHDPAEIARMLAAADVYVFPSRHEGFPVAPLEAMGCGLPVVASAASGIRDLLTATPEEHGGVIVPREDPGALAGALDALLGEPDRRRKLGGRARARAEQFGHEAVGRRLRAFLMAPAPPAPDTPNPVPTRVQALGRAARVTLAAVREPAGAGPGRVPRSPVELTPQWLTSALGRTVTSVSPAEASTGTTTRASVVVSYEDGEPERLFVKCTASLAQRLMLGLGGLLYGEPGFYTHVRPLLEIEAPRPFFAAVDRATWRSIVVTDDVVAARGARFWAPGATIGRAEIEDLLTGLAAWHGALWDSPRLVRWRWLRTTAEQMDLIDTLIGMANRLPAGARRAREVIPASLHGRQADLYEGLRRSMRSAAAEPPTYLHGDLHVANTYRAAGGRMGVVDWQVGLKGSWAHDFGYLLGTALDVEDRRAWEVELLELYLDRLTAAGGPRLSRARARDAYRSSLLYPYFAWVYTIGRASLQPRFQPDDVCLTIIGRVAAAIDDLQALRSVGL